MDPDPRRRQWTDAIRSLVEAASDEQLAGMVGPDRRFYAEEAVRAAEEELEARREAAASGRDRRRVGFNAAAMALGPFWYIYHGMVGRGAIIAAVLVGAAAGLGPVVRTLGISPTLWVAIVVVAGAIYCGLFADRDLIESRQQARTAKGAPARPTAAGHRAAAGGEAGHKGPQLALVAQVGCREAAEHARTLLRRGGIDAVITTSKGDEGDEAQTRVLVPKAHLLKARGMVQSFLSSEASECAEPEPGA